MTNEDKYKNYKVKKILRYLIIIFNFSVIVLESFALFQVISLYWGFIPLMLTIICKYFYEKDGVKKEKNNKMIKKEK